MDFEYKRQQALHHQAALQKLSGQLQLPFASTSSMQSSPVTSSTYNSAVLIPPVPALETSLHQGSLSNKGFSVNSSLSPNSSCLQPLKATAAHFSLADKTDTNPQSMDTINATSMWAACQANTSYHPSQVYGYTAGGAGKFSTEDLNFEGDGMGLSQREHNLPTLLPRLSTR
jgi:hypothetical protein